MIMKTGCRGCFCHFNPTVSVHSGHRVPHRQWRCRWVSSLSLILRLRPFLHHYGTDRAHGHATKKEIKYHRHGMATRPPNQKPTGKAEVMLKLTRRTHSRIRSCKENWNVFKVPTQSVRLSVCSFQVFRVQTFFALPVMATARRCLQQILHQ